MQVAKDRDFFLGASTLSLYIKSLICIAFAKSSLKLSTYRYHECFTYEIVDVAIPSNKALVGCIPNPNIYILG